MRVLRTTVHVRCTDSIRTFGRKLLRVRVNSAGLEERNYQNVQVHDLYSIPNGFLFFLSKTFHVPICSVEFQSLLVRSDSFFFLENYRRGPSSAVQCSYAKRVRFSHARAIINSTDNDNNMYDVNTASVRVITKQVRRRRGPCPARHSVLMCLYVCANASLPGT